MAYNSFGQLITDYQAHSGAVSTGTSPKVQYGYANGSANTVRPTTMTYPDGRVLIYNYGAGSSMADALSRIAALIDDNGTTHLADYSYLGLGSFVEVDYTEPDIKYTLIGTAGGNDPDTGDIYRGMDRFSRIKDLLWYNYTSATDVERVKHGYDRASNRTYRLNPVDANREHDEYYWYDRVHRLGEMERGTLNSGNTGIEMLEFAQCWSLDATGNWSGFREDSNGDHAWDLVQSRTSNPANEISVITTDLGAAWATPIYDRAGNMTSIPQPAVPTLTYTATYDAWNRLVKLVSGSNTVAEYEYDGTKRRIVSKTYSAGVLSETRHHYYTEAWQAIEERVGSSADAERQFVFGKRYVDDLVLRDRDSDDDGSLEERLYGMQDPNWNVTAIATTSGTVQERYAYTAYGIPTFMTDAFGSRTGSSFAWEQLFAGYDWENVSGLYHVRNRSFAPPLGTWIQRDSLGLAAGVNLYTYVNSNPPNETDPLGFQGFRHDIEQAILRLLRFLRGLTARGVRNHLSLALCGGLGSLLAFLEVAEQAAQQGRRHWLAPFCSFAIGCLVGLVGGQIAGHFLAQLLGLGGPDIVLPWENLLLRHFAMVFIAIGGLQGICNLCAAECGFQPVGC